LPLSNKNYSYVLPLLLFDTLDLHDFQQLDLLLGAIIGTTHAKQQTRTTKNNTPIKKRLKKDNRVWF
jgi:hypothetical protein